MNNNELNHHWHLRREVTVGQIVSTLILAGMMVAGWVQVQRDVQDMRNHIQLPAHSSMEQRMDVIEVEVAAIKEVKNNMIRQIETMNQEIIRRLERIEDRLNQHQEATEARG